MPTTTRDRNLEIDLEAIVKTAAIPCCLQRYTSAGGRRRNSLTSMTSTWDVGIPACKLTVRSHTCPLNTFLMKSVRDVFPSRHTAQANSLPHPWIFLKIKNLFLKTYKWRSLSAVCNHMQFLSCFIYLFVYFQGRATERGEREIFHPFAPLKDHISHTWASLKLTYFFKKTMLESRQPCLPHAGGRSAVQLSWI